MMATKVKALKNISNRPLELIFDDKSERISPMDIGKYHTDEEWANSLAKKQADEFIKRNEAKYIEKDSSAVSDSDFFIKPNRVEVEKKSTRKKEESK